MSLESNSLEFICKLIDKLSCIGCCEYVHSLNFQMKFYKGATPFDLIDLNEKIFTSKELMFRPKRMFRPISLHRFVVFKKDSLYKISRDKDLLGYNNKTAVELYNAILSSPDINNKMKRETIDNSNLFEDVVFV